MNAESRTPKPEHGSHTPAGTVAEQSVSNTLRRCHASVLRIADLIETGEPILAVETCHLVATDLEDLLEAEAPADGMVRLGDSPEFKAELLRLSDHAPEPFASQLRATASRDERRSS